MHRVSLEKKFKLGDSLRDLYIVNQVYGYENIEQEHSIKRCSLERLTGVSTTLKTCSPKASEDGQKCVVGRLQIVLPSSSPRSQGRSSSPDSEAGAAAPELSHPSRPMAGDMPERLCRKSSLEVLQPLE